MQANMPIQEQRTGTAIVVAGLMGGRHRRVCASNVPESRPRVLWHGKSGILQERQLTIVHLKPALLATLRASLRAAKKEGQVSGR